MDARLFQVSINCCRVDPKLFADGGSAQTVFGVQSTPFSLVIIAMLPTVIALSRQQLDRILPQLIESRNICPSLLSKDTLNYVIFDDQPLELAVDLERDKLCLLYTSPSPRD